MTIAVCLCVRYLTRCSKPTELDFMKLGGKLQEELRDQVDWD